MKHLRFLVLLLFIPQALSAQAADTVYVDIVLPADPPDTLYVEIVEKVDSMVVGQGFVFIARTFNQDSVPMEATVRWRSTNVSKLTIDSISGLAQAVDSGGVAVIASASVDPTEPPPPGTLFLDGFESGDFDNAVGGSWGSANARVTDAISHTGRYAAELEWLTADDGADGRDAWAHLTATLDEPILGSQGMWAEGWIYFPDGSEGLGPAIYHRDQGTDPGAETWKIYRAYAAPYIEGPAIGLDLASADGAGGSMTQIPFRGDGGPLWGGWKIAATHPRVKGLGDGGVLPLGRWIQLRFEHRESTCATCYDGLFRMWVDGDLIYDIPDILEDVLEWDTPKSFWGDEGKHYWDTIYWFNHSNAGFNEPRVATLVDDVSVGRGTPPW